MKAAGGLKSQVMKAREMQKSKDQKISLIVRAQFGCS